MDFSEEEFNTHVDELEEEAGVIEKSLKSFFRQVNVRKGRFFGLINWWRQLDEESKQHQRKTRRRYEIWYNSSEPLVEEYMPHRIKEFRGNYEKFSELINLDDDIPVPKDSNETLMEAIDVFDNQRSILESIPHRIEAEKFSAQKQISTRIEKDELQRAKELFSEDLIRSSGVLAGVALERHLLTACETSERDVQFDRTHSIERLSQSLYEADEIPKENHKQLTYLGSVRAKCAHAGEQPGSEEVERLINDVEDYIRHS